MDHCNFTPRTYGFFEDDNFTYTLQDFVKSKDLFDFLAEDKPHLNEFDIFTIFRSLVSIVHALHQNGVIHNDLKPENVMIDTETKSIALIDFGLSHILSDPNDDTCGGTSGTLEYQPFEKLSSKDSSNCRFGGKKSDTYSLGVVLFVLFFNRLPFNKHEIHQRMNAIKVNVKVTTAEKQRLSKEAIHLITRLLHDDPHQRLGVDDIYKSSWFKEFES